MREGVWSARRAAVLLCVAWLGGLGGIAWAAEPPRYTLGVLPGASPVAQHLRWAPVVDRLAVRTGLPLDLRLYESMAAFERAIAQGTHDLLFLHPGQMAIAQQAQAYVPLVRGGRPIAGVVFVAAESPVQTVRELDGKPLAILGTKNVCSILVRTALAGAGGTLQPVLAGSTRNVYEFVRLGKADAGVTLDVDFETQPTPPAFRPLLTTPAVPAHPLAAHPRVPAAARAVLRQALLDLGSDPAGQDLLQAVGLGAPVPADYARDYRRHEAADIRRLTDWGQ